MYSVLLLGAFATSALSQAITFSNTTFTAPVAVGATWPISFGAGNGEDVAIAFGNSTYAFQIVDGLSAPGVYSWKVAVPVNVVAGIYQLALLQGDEDPVFSPAFSLVIPAESSSSTTDVPTTAVPFPTGAGATATTTETTTVTAIYLPGPTGISPNGTSPIVTWIYWEESCGCHQTSTCDYTALPTSMSTTTVTYSEEACGCTTTVEAPCAETAIPVPVTPTAAPAPPPAPVTNAPVAPATVSAVPATPTPTSPAAPQATTPAAYTGAAEKIASSSFGFLALLAVLVVA